MSLARAWRRQLSEAWTAAVLVPGTMLAALVVLALAGGFGRIAAVGQAFAGPSVPAHAPGARSSGGAVGATASAGALQALAFAPSSFTAPARRGAVAGVPAARSGKPSTRLGGGHPHSQPPPPVNHAPPPAAAPPSPAAPAPPPSTPGPPAPHPTLIDRVVSLGTAITTKIPGPLGNVSTTTLESVGSALNRILPLPTRAARSATSASQ